MHISAYLNTWMNVRTFYSIQTFMHTLLLLSFFFLYTFYLLVFPLTERDCTANIHTYLSLLYYISELHVRVPLSYAILTLLNSSNRNVKAVYYISHFYACDSLNKQRLCIQHPFKVSLLLLSERILARANFVPNETIHLYNTYMYFT